MPHRRRLPRLAALAAVLLGSLLSAPHVLAAGAATSSDDESRDGVVALRGKVVCLDDPCLDAAARFELRTESGERVGFLADDPRALMFIDPRVRQRTLEIHGWRRPATPSPNSDRPAGAIEILSIHSIVDGKPHRLHYRCDVCNIDATAPGPCWCCGQEFELREVPLAASADAERHSH